MTDKQFRFARTSQCHYLGQHENACSQANCTQSIRHLCRPKEVAHRGSSPEITRFSAAGQEVDPWRRFAAASLLVFCWDIMLSSGLGTEPH